MKEISTTQAIAMRKDLLKAFHEVCMKNGLKYSLGYGTLLGAVRHQGMIPWDDDIDVVMLRGEYERLCEMYADPHQTERYQLVNHRNHPEVPTKISYFNDFSTITDLCGKRLEYEGVHIDIYPLDILPNDEKKRGKMLSDRKIFQRIIKIKDIHPEVFRGYQKAARLALKAVFSVFNGPATYRRLDNISKQYAHLSPEYGSFVSCLVESGKVCIFDRNVTEKYRLYQYEGWEFYGFEDYDKPLTAWYGDYMTPPPVEQRIIPSSKWVHHYFKDADSI